MRIFAFIILLLIIAKAGLAQDTTKTKQFHNKQFNWTINLPPGFDTVSTQEWAKVKNAGTQAVEKTYNRKIKDETTVLLVLSGGRTNFFEALSQPFDPKKDGSYTKLCKTVDQVIYHTLATQIPGASIDSVSTNSIIGNLNFNAFILRANLPNGLTYSVYSFTRLFGNVEFALNIMFIDNTKGDIMLNAWKHSTFGPAN